MSVKPPRVFFFTPKSAAEEMRKFETKNSAQSFVCRQIKSTINGSAQLSCEAVVAAPGGLDRQQKSTPIVQATKGQISCGRGRNALCETGGIQEFQLTLDLVDGFWNEFTDESCNSLDLSFIANIVGIRQGDVVHLQIPALSFTIPETQNECYLSTASIPPPAGGYITTIDQFLPDVFIPNTVIPLTFTIQSAELPPVQDPPLNPPAVGIVYELQIDTEGRIKIGASGYNPIPPGGHRLLPTSISYLVLPSDQKAPKNVAISLTASTPNLNCSVNEFLEIQMSSFENGRVAYVFADNSATQDISNCNIRAVIAVADVVTVNGVPRLQFNVPQHTYDPTTIGYSNGRKTQAGAEWNIAINPTNKDNIVATGRVRVANAPANTRETFPVTRFATIALTTFDGGLTWSDQIRVDTQELVARGDTRLKTDPYGNFWIMFDSLGTTFDPSTLTGVSIAIFVSSDGGLNWHAVAEAAPPPNNTFGFDYPMLQWGGDGNGGIAMYFSWMLYINDTEGNAIFNNYLAAISVGGLGGPFGDLLVINDFPQIDGLIGFGNLAATPDGTVIYTAGDTGLATGVPLLGVEEQNYLIVHHGGLNDFTPAGFSEPRLVSFDTIATNNIFGQHSVVWQAARGVIGGPATQGLVYDVNTERLYAMIVSERHPKTIIEITVPGDSSDQASLFYNQGIVNLVWSYDFGQTWSRPIPLRDSIIGQAGIVTLNVDSTNGDLAFGWYDPREDPIRQQEVKWYGGVLSPPADACQRPNISTITKTQKTRLNAAGNSTGRFGRHAADDE